MGEIPMYGNNLGIKPNDMNMVERAEKERRLEQAAMKQQYDQMQKTLGCQVEQKHDAEITIEMRRLGTQIEDLEGALRALGERLMPVTRQAGSCTPTDRLASPPCTTPLGTGLRQACERIEEMTFRVSQQIDMTEL